MKIKFNRIHIEYFKSIDNLETEFGDKTYIYGANETGKTSFADAISWCLTGKNSLGDSQFEFVSIGGIGVSPSVILEIDMEDGKTKKNVELQRVYQAKMNRSKEFTGEYQTVCYINGLKVGPKEFDKWVEEHICKPEIFRLIHDVRYFTENITVNGRERPWEAQRRLLFSISGIKPDVEFARLKKRFEPIMDGLQRYDNASQYLSFLKSEEKKIDDKIRYYNAQLVTMESMAGKDSEDIVAIDQEILRLKLQKINLETSIEQAKEKAERDREEKIKLIKGLLDSKMIEFRTEQAGYTKMYNKLNEEMKKLQERKNNIYIHLLSAKKDLNEAQEDLESVHIQCPTCGQYIPTDIVEEQKKRLENEIHDLNLRIKDFQEEYDRISDDVYCIQGEIESLKAPTISDEIRELQDELSDTQLSGIGINSDDSEKLNDVTIRLNDLIGRKNNYEKNKGILEGIEKIKKSIKEEVEGKAKNSRLMDLCKDFIDAKCKYAEKKVNEMFDGIEFKLFRQNKINNELRDCCDIFWNGVPYDSLSYSTKFVVSMKIALAFQKFYKVYMPIVTDNAESIDLSQEIPVQSIMLIKRDERCPICGGETDRKGQDGLWKCKVCENKFAKSLAIEMEWII